MPCFHCGKGVVFGRSHTHHRGVAGGRWKKRAPKTRKIFLPNLQKVSIIEKGKEKRVKLCTKCLKRVEKDLEQRGVGLEIDDIALEALAKVGFDPEFGARPMRRAIQEHVENKLAELIIGDKLKRRDVVMIGEGLEIKVK